MQQGHLTELCAISLLINLYITTVLTWGNFVLGGFCPRGDFVLPCRKRGILTQEGLCPGEFCPSPRLMIRYTNYTRRQPALERKIIYSNRFVWVGSAANVTKHQKCTFRSMSHFGCASRQLRNKKSDQVDFYCAMHFSAKHGIAIVIPSVCLSVYPSVCLLRSCTVIIG